MDLKKTPAPARVEPGIPAQGRKKKLSIRELLKPHVGALIIGLLAVMGEGAANLLQPWPLKIVLDDVLRSRESNASVMRWVHALIGMDKLAMLKFACLAVLAIAALDAIASYLEKYLTTTVGQWVSYDLRRGL
jgi:subfamily B ATP-binding cassette protein MsbA